MLVGVSMTFNDGFKLKEWRENYDDIKEQLEKFIIVDNGSEAEYVQQLKATFPEAIIIERGNNGGCTAAYNDGIKYALQNTKADAILIVANDIKATPNCLPAMEKYLFSDETIGMVSTAILNKDSDIVDNYGHVVNNFSVKNLNQGDKITEVSPLRKITDLVSGGFTMAKREFYEKAGLQDEALFMYCDELDTTFKARAVGFKLGVIANEYAWHRHINNPKIGKYSPASRYLISRNRVYLAKKHTGFGSIVFQMYRGAILTPIIFVVKAITKRNKEYLRDARYSFKGAIDGLCGRMYQNKYTVL